jgi:hypothetical protein
LLRTIIAIVMARIIKNAKMDLEFAKLIVHPIHGILLGGNNRLSSGLK